MELTSWYAALLLLLWSLILYFALLLLLFSPFLSYSLLCLIFFFSFRGNSTNVYFQVAGLTTNALKFCSIYGTSFSSFFFLMNRREEGRKKKNGGDGEGLLLFLIFTYSTDSSSADAIRDGTTTLTISPDNYNQKNDDGSYVYGMAENLADYQV